MIRILARPLAVAALSGALVAVGVAPAEALSQLRVTNLVSPAKVDAAGTTVIARFDYKCTTESTSAFVSVDQFRGSDGYGFGSESASRIVCDGTERRSKVRVPITEGVVKPGHVDVFVTMSGFLDDEVITSSLGETLNVVRK